MWHKRRCCHTLNSNLNPRSKVFITLYKTKVLIKTYPSAYVSSRITVSLFQTLVKKMLTVMELEMPAMKTQMGMGS